MPYLSDGTWIVIGEIGFFVIVAIGGCWAWVAVEPGSATRVWLSTHLHRPDRQLEHLRRIPRIEPVPQPIEPLSVPPANEGQGATVDWSPTAEAAAVDPDPEPGEMTPLAKLPTRGLKPETRVPTSAALEADVHNAFDAHWDDALAGHRLAMDRAIEALNHPSPVRHYRTAVAVDDTQAIDVDALNAMLNANPAVAS